MSDENLIKATCKEPINLQNFIFYTDTNGDINIQMICNTSEQTIWLNQKQIAEVFDSTKQNVSYHISNILSEGELEHSSVKEFLTVRTDGTKIGIKHYNLDMIISASIFWLINSL